MAYNFQMISLCIIVSNRDRQKDLTQYHEPSKSEGKKEIVFTITFICMNINLS